MLPNFNNFTYKCGSMQDTPLTAPIDGPAQDIHAARALRSLAPTWALGIEEAGTAQALTQGLTRHATASPQAARVAPSFAAWAFGRRPLDSALAETVAGMPPERSPGKPWQPS